MFPARAHLSLSLVFLSHAKLRLRLGDRLGISAFGGEPWALSLGCGYVVHLAPSGEDTCSV